ncbi:MAG: calcium-binding protein, partial [Pseudomonadota bacterium]|nr:calcium-binding protein [Pseudomonadota bacterium]
MAGGGGSDSINGDSGNDILLGDFGSIQLSSNWIAERVVSTSIDSAFSGTDQLSGGAGNDILMAGAALAGESEALVDLLGNNTMIGDFADVSGARVLEAVTSLISIASDVGGADSIETGRGNDLILGGEGDDSISSGLGGDLIFGDNGVLDMTGGTMQTTGSDADGSDLITIGADPIGAGDPPSPSDIRDIVIGGLGNDTVNAIDGGLVFIGDAGSVTLDPVALNALRTFRPAGSSATEEQIEAEERALQLISNIASALESSAHADDGDDSISITGGDAMAVLGGGSDIANLSLADGMNYILGDDGTLTIVPNDDYSGRLTLLTTATSAALVNNDTISAGNGDNLIVGGEGFDLIATGDGDNQILGDSGSITHDDRTDEVTSVLVSASLVSDGDDLIISGDGRNRIVAGGGDDVVQSGDGGNLIIGDSGTISDLPTGVTLTSSDPLTGGDDIVVAGVGNDLVILGAGADLATLNEGDNSVLGDNGSIVQTYTADDAEFVLTSASQVSDGNDIVTAGNGRNRVLTGGADDTVSLGDGGNLIITDSGTISDL